MVRKAISEGYVTLNIDRVGSGLSSKPDGLDNTIDSAAYVLHQIVQALRDGTLTGEKFGSVVLVGHSLGSVISIAEAVSYHDVDGLILTGFTHNLSPIGAVGLMAFLYQTTLDPMFGPEAPANYFTTLPDSRGLLFYYPVTAAPDVVALDEKTKDVLSMGQLEVLTRISSTESLKIDVPVFLLVGSQDLIFCGGPLTCATSANVLAFESSFFSPSARLQVLAVSDTAHDLNLHRNAQGSYRP